MSKDYKPAPQKSKPEGKGSPFFTGLLIGLLLGVGASLGVALLINQGETPFQDKLASAPEIAAPPKTVDASGGLPANTQQTPETTQQKKEDRFTFYNILTGSESPVTEQEVKQATEQKTPQQGTENSLAENYFLQVGAFQTEQEADNMKAKLALLGLEAVVQTANIPAKGVLHRVRVGPLANLDEINKARGELARNNFNADLIKIHNNIPDQ